MAKVFELRVVGDTSDIEAKIKELGGSIKEVKNEAGKTSKEIENVTSNGGAIAILDRLTGGLASQFRDAFEATKLFNGSLKATRGALIATGIGALVVALGTIVAYWDEIVDFITQANKKLEEQKMLLKSNEDLLSAQIERIRAEEDLREIRGQSIDDLILKEKELLKRRIANRKEVVKTREEELKLAVQRFNEITAGEKFLQFFGVDARSKEDLQAIKELRASAAEARKELAEAEKELIELEDRTAVVITAKPKPKDDSTPQKRDLRTVGETDAKTEEKQAQKRIAFLQMVEDAENEYFDRKLSKEELEKRAVNDKYFFLIEQAKLYGENTLILEEAQRAALKEISDKYDAEEEEARKKKEEQDIRLKEEERKREEDLANYKIQTAGNVLNALNSIAEKGSAGAKAIAIAQAVLSTYQGINKALAETTDFTPTQTLRFANAAAVGIAGFANVSKILSTDSSGSSSFSGATATGGSSPAPPSFNLVRGTGENQLLEGITRQQDPIEAYVVSDRVTSRAALNRNRASEASLG